MQDVASGVSQQCSVALLCTRPRLTVAVVAGLSNRSGARCEQFNVSRVLSCSSRRASFGRVSSGRQSCRNVSVRERAQKRLRKSALATRFLSDLFRAEAAPFHIEMWNHKPAGVDGRQVRFDVLDAAGGVISDTRRDWMRECDVIMMCSIFSEAGTMARISQKLKALVGPHFRDNVSVILVRTMADLELPFVEREVVLKWVRKVGTGLVSTSSKTGLNVEEAFFMAVRLCVARGESVRLAKARK